MNKTIDISIYNQSLDKSRDKNFYLYYVLKGQIFLHLAHGISELNEKDLLLLNPNEDVAVDCHDGAFARLTISSNELLRMMDYKKIVFVCDSRKGDGQLFDKLRLRLNKLIELDIEMDEHYLHYQKEMFDFLSFLVTNFANNLFIENEDEARKNSILAYIHANYAEDLSLQVIAEKFNVTPQYFSRYFKETFQVTFLKFLTDIRLEQALEDVVNSPDTLSKIALSHGFPNQISFTKSFKAHFGVTPTDYRKSHFEKKETIEEVNDAEVQRLLLSKPEQTKEKLHQIYVEIGDEPETLKPFWFDIVNIGSISRVFENGLNDQLLELKSSMPFKTARVILDNHLTQNTTFFIEEKTLDFLVSLDFKIMLVLDYRDISNQPSFQAYFEQFLNHFANRYGIKILKSMTFELLYNTYFSESKASNYAKLYEKLSRVLNKLGLSKNLVGPGLLMDTSGGNLARFLEKNQHLPKLTINIAPYSIEKLGTKYYINRKPDTNYIVQQYELAKEICLKHDITEVVITSWKDALNEFSVINDSSYRGASILKNIIDAYGRVESLPLEQPFDLMVPITSNKPLSGLPGILTKDGIKKPAYYSLKFLNQLDKYFLYKDDSMLISYSNRQYIQLVCHNCKSPNYRFYNQENEGTIISDFEELFEDNQPKTIKLTISGLKNGQYFLKSRELSEEQGGCLHIFNEMGFENSSFFGRDELDYLLSASKPMIKGKRMHTTTNSLEIEIVLQPNEIRHLHLIYVH